MIDPGLAIISHRLTCIATHRGRGTPNHHAQDAFDTRAIFVGRLHSSRILPNLSSGPQQRSGAHSAIHACSASIRADVPSWEGEIKRRPLVHCALRPDLSAVTVDDALYRREADTGAGKFRVAV
jgi:hypothetical protein